MVGSGRSLMVARNSNRASHTTLWSKTSSDYTDPTTTTKQLSDTKCLFFFLFIETYGPSCIITIFHPILKKQERKIITNHNHSEIRAHQCRTLKTASKWIPLLLERNIIRHTQGILCKWCFCIFSWFTSSFQYSDLRHATWSWRTMPTRHSAPLHRVLTIKPGWRQSRHSTLKKLLSLTNYFLASGFHNSQFNFRLANKQQLLGICMVPNPQQCHSLCPSAARRPINSSIIR